jgi:membrane protein
VRRPPVAGWELATVKFRTRTIGLVRERWVAITVTSLVSHLSLYLVLLVTLRHVGVSWPTVLQWTAAILRFVLLAVLLMAGLAALYRYAPDRDKPRWNWSSPGSVVATVLWVLASVGFSIYANAFGNYNKTYGALVGIIILMFWLYLTAFVVLVGAELNAEMEL